jgi:uncharacterized protein YjeT (DUF2065 family)
VLKIFITALGLAFILEGLPYFALPRGVKEWLRMASEMEDSTLRALGFFAMASGLILVYLAQKTALFR